MWNVEELTGYKPITTFWDDFTIAEKFGISAIKDTYKRAFNEWKDNYKYLTELVMVTNHKIWAHYPHNLEIAKVYDSIWKELDEYAITKLKGDELSYYYQVTD